MNIALYAFLGNRLTSHSLLPMCQTAMNNKPDIEAWDPDVLSDYIEMKANVMAELQDGIQRSPSESSLFFRYSCPEDLKTSRLTDSRKNALRNNIRRGWMMLPGNILLMKAAQSNRKQIRYGVKSTVGHRPNMEDSHITKPFFFRIPISLACTRQLIPDFVQTELEKVDDSIEKGSGRTSQTEMLSLAKDIQCVFDEFDLFLICDGHGGAQVSQYCTANFKKILKQQLKTSVEARYLELLQSAKKTERASESSNSCNSPERSSKSATSTRERTSPRSPNRSRLRISESFRTHSSREFRVEEKSGPSNGLAAAQCGLDVNDLRDCLSRSFLLLDDEIRENKLGDFEGSTALAALVGRWHICVANCGDSRAVLSRNGAAVRMSRDHKPHLPEERARIEKQGGFVLNAYGCSRVNGFLAMSRAIGDHLIPSVIAQPDVTILHRHPLDEFLICATDGLWDVISDEEACVMTRKCLIRAEAKGAKKLSSRVAANVLLKAALDRGSTDNITIAVVDLRMSQESKAVSEIE